MAAVKNSSPGPPTSRLEEILNISDRIQELSDSEGDEYEDMGTVTHHEEANIAYINRITVPIRDNLSTETSKTQDKTLDVILPFLEGNPNNFPLNIFGLPHLQRDDHKNFLLDSLEDYPSNFTPMDASRPWLVYWGLQGLSVLGDSIYKEREIQERVIKTFALAQHPEGGFGGGYGQLPHLAATYAAVLSLIMVGGSSAYESIDRRTMWHYLGRMKQADGGFTMAPGGEEDIRGAYCALVALSLLNLPMELPPDAPARAHGMTSFTDKLAEWVSKCQTYEGGISAAPGSEAHGAYAFCGLACLSIMGPPKETLNKYLDVPLLIHWLSYRQCSPEGGYSGRTNKLVDGCYSHWVGSCWSMVEAAAGKGIWNRSALARYILSAAQAKGGLRDKPGKRADSYHTCYNLAGLSAVQHCYVFDEASEELGKGELGAPYCWKTEGRYEEDVVWDEADLIGEVHPIFVVPPPSAAACRAYFEAKEGF